MYELKGKQYKGVCYVMLFKLLCVCLCVCVFVSECKGKVRVCSVVYVWMQKPGEGVGVCTNCVLCE